VTGIAVAGLSVVLKGEADQRNASLAVVVSALLFVVVAVLGGGLVVAILARLRRAQIEHFRIMNNIREHFLGDDLPAWRVVELSRSTLPTPNRKSGTFMWLLMILVVSALATGLGLYVLMHDVVSGASDELVWTVVVAGSAAVPFGLQALYFALAKVPERPDYGALKSPFDPD
jgi:hypothetical protein